MRALALLALAPLAAAVGPATATAAPCRALLNFATSDGAAGQNAVVDVRTDGSAERFRGLAVGAGAQIDRLIVAPFARQKPGYEDRYEVLQTVAAKPARWYGGTHGFEGKPDGDMTWDYAVDLMVTGVFGRHVSLHSQGYGYLGGAHDVDEPGEATLAGGKVVDASALVGSAALTKGKAIIAAETKKRDGWPGGPNPDRLDLRDAALSITPTGLRLSKTLDCCSWAENHNRWDLDIDVATPASLAHYVPDAAGWLTAPDGCKRAIKIDNGMIVVKGDAVQVAGPAPGRLLGVAWVEESAPALARVPADPARAKALLAQARGTVSAGHRAALLEAARHADYYNAEVLAEAGWLAFQAKAYDRALGLTRAALELVADPALDGRIRYNLGRIHEVRGALPRAARLYAASLARRPNKTVEKRLKAVRARLGETP